MTSEHDPTRPDAPAPDEPTTDAEPTGAEPAGDVGTFTVEDLLGQRDDRVTTTFHATPTWESQWRSLPLAGHERANALIVMGGIEREHRHPAFRVTPSTAPDAEPATYATQITDALTMTFHRDAHDLTWLTCTLAQH